MNDEPITANEQIMRQMQEIKRKRLLDAMLQQQEKKPRHSPMIGVRADADEYTAPMRGFPANTIPGGTR